MKTVRSRLAGLTMLATAFSVAEAHAFNMDSISSVDLTTRNVNALSQGNGLGAPETESCRVKVLSYFSDENLTQINNDLGRLANWINDNFYYSDDVIEDFLGEQPDEDGSKDIAYAAFNNVRDSLKVYNPGTSDGTVYLKDPVLAVGAIFAHVDYADQLKSMMGAMGHEKELKEFSKQFDSDLKRLRSIAESTEHLMTNQMTQAKCGLVLAQ